MAVSSCNPATTFPSLKLSNSTPPLATPIPTVRFPFRSTRKWPEIAVSVAAMGNFGALKGGTGLLERPTFDQSQFDPPTQTEEGGDIGRLRDKKSLGSGDSYKVLLIDDPRHTESLVEKALPQVIPSITVSQARELFHESREKGFAVVIVTVKEHAEFYAQMMLCHGLRSAIEPDSDMA